MNGHLYKRWSIPKGQPNMDNPEKLATYNVGYTRRK